MYDFHASLFQNLLAEWPIYIKLVLYLTVIKFYFPKKRFQAIGGKYVIKEVWLSATVRYLRMSRWGEIDFSDTRWDRFFLLKFWEINLNLKSRTVWIKFELETQKNHNMYLFQTLTLIRHFENFLPKFQYYYNKK